METPYLIQRLNAPMGEAANVFSFGGGLLYGGLSKEALSLLRGIWSYDYMGSAEFEFGALPKSLNRIVNNRKNYVTGSCLVKAKRRDYRKNKTITEEAVVYYCCKKEDVADVIKWVGVFADETGKLPHTKEYVGLGRAITKDEYCRTKGWHDIYNDFLFFIDEEICQKFCQLFEIGFVPANK